MFATEEMVTVQDLADELGTTQSQVQQYVKEGKIRTVDTPGGPRVLLSEGLRLKRPAPAPAAPRGPEQPSLREMHVMALDLSRRAMEQLGSWQERCRRAEQRLSRLQRQSDALFDDLERYQRVIAEQNLEMARLAAERVQSEEEITLLRQEVRAQQRQVWQLVDQLRGALARSSRVPAWIRRWFGA